MTFFVFFAQSKMLIYRRLPLPVEPAEVGAGSFNEDLLAQIV
jgi:hypothetical protein